MAYYLRQDKKKKGLYLQMYESFWDKEKKQPRSRNIESFGYVSELISDEIPDPVSYYQKYVAEKNREHAASVADETRPRVFATQLEKNIGYFLVDSLLSELNVKETVDILALQKRFQFNLYDMIAQLIYARILYPCSKSKTVSTVFPRLYHSVPISEDQVYDGCAFIGNPIKNILNCSTTAMKSITGGISAVFFLTALTTILKLTSQRKINKRGLPKKTGMNRSLARHCFWMQTWFRLPCRCIPEMSQRNRTSEKSYRK